MRELRLNQLRWEDRPTTSIIGEPKNTAPGSRDRSFHSAPPERLAAECYRAAAAALRRRSVR
jgi:hypothetical protein